MTIEQIRRELQDIRYYYSRKAIFDRASDCVAKNAAVALARKYNEAVRTAPPKLYDLYISLYTDRRYRDRDQFCTSDRTFPRTSTST